MQGKDAGLYLKYLSSRQRKRQCPFVTKPSLPVTYILQLKDGSQQDPLFYKPAIFSSENIFWRKEDSQQNSLL